MRLRIANAVFYALLATFGAAALAGRLVPSVRALLQPFSYAPTLRYPALWLLLAAALLTAVFVAARRLFLGVKIGIRLYGVLLFLVASALAATRLVPPARRPPAAEVLDHLVARVEAAASEDWARAKAYPSDVARFDAALPEALREPGFRARPGLLLRSRVHVTSPATGPILSAPEGVRPGDVAYGVDADRRRYWITVFTLDRRGRIRPLSSGGKVLVVAGVDGRPSLQQDPLFPDYPRKSSGRTPRAAQPGATNDGTTENADVGVTPNPVDAGGTHSGAETRHRDAGSP